MCDVAIPSYVYQNILVYKLPHDVLDSLCYQRNVLLHVGTQFPVTLSSTVQIFCVEY